MNKKSVKKALLLVLCAILLVVASVMGTLAYLTDKDVVNNTFTAGKVGLSLDETKVDVYGAPVSPAAKTQENAYILVPGHEYKKDPIVHVDANSENSFIYVKVENGIKAYEKNEDAYNTIEEQILTNSWTKLPDVDNVYYKSYAKTATIVDLPVFQTFTVEETLDNAGLPASQVTVGVTAYAIQTDGFADAKTAWDALQDQLNSTP